MFWILAIVSTIVIGIYGIVKYVNGNDGHWPKHGIKLIKTSEVAPVWARYTFSVPPQDLDKKIYDKFKASDPKIKMGGTMQFRRPLLYIFDPDLIKNVTVKDFDHFSNRRPFPVDKDDPSHIGQSVFSLENQEWKDMRSTLSPTFTTGKIRRMFDIFNDSAQQMTEYLLEEIKGSGSNEIELKEICGRFTMNVIASSAFGVESNSFRDKDSVFYRMGQRFQNQFSGITILKFMLAQVFPSISKFVNVGVFDQKALAFFCDVIKKTVKHREESGEKRDDFVQLLLETRSEPNANSGAGDDSSLEAFERDAQLKNTTTSKVYMTDELILAQSILFFFAGFDTTETLLIYAAYELAINPEVQETLAAEIREAVEKKGKLTYETVIELSYLDMVVSETLRKYTPGVRLERQCTKDYKIPGHDYVVRKDDIVVIPTYAIHFDPEIYPNPQKFDPTRFNGENKALRNPYTYQPFGIGPRNCIAMRFALTEGKAAIAELVRSFVLEPSPKTNIPMKYSKSGIMKPDGGMWLKLTPRT